MTSFSFFKYLDAFKLDVNVVNFVYYGKTRLWKGIQSHTGKYNKKNSKVCHESKLLLFKKKNSPCFLGQTV